MDGRLIEFNGFLLYHTSHTIYIRETAISTPILYCRGCQKLTIQYRYGGFVTRIGPVAIWPYTVNSTVHSPTVIEQLFNNYFSFCPCLLLFGFVDNIIKGQQHESDFISFYLCLSLFGYLLSPYLLISSSYPIG